MKEILIKYKDRLVNLSGKNRSLSMKKLYKKRAFDLYNLKEFDEEIYGNILDYINQDKKSSCCILGDYSSFYKEEVSELKKLYKEEKDKLEVNRKEIKISKDDKIFQDKKKKIEEIYETSLVKIEKRKDKIISYGKSLKSLNKEIGDIEKETGKKELYLAYPFVEGNFKDGTFFKAPLMLYQIAIGKVGDSWTIIKNSDSKIKINKVFLLAIEKYNELKVEGIEEEYDELSEDTVIKVLNKLETFGVYLEKNLTGLEKVKEYTTKTTPSYNLGSGKLVENMVLGQFPLANSIYNDYEELITGDLSNNLLEALLKTGDNYNLEHEEKEEHGKLSFSEKDLFLISKLDYSQELAVKKADESDKIVIYGPPGTGKSQTITNVISNNIAKGKRVLMVSQKKAALDVIYNRLGELNSKAIIIHDINSDKKKFYSTVATSLNLEDKDEKDYISKITENAKSIDDKILRLEKIAKILTEETSFGLNLQEMYSKSKVIEAKEDTRFDRFMKYRKITTKEGFDKVKYDELVKSVEGIDEQHINSFLKSKELINENINLQNMNLDMNTIEIAEAINSLELVIEKEEEIQKSKSEHQNLFEGFWEIISDNKGKLSEDKVKKVAQNLNLLNNKELTIKYNVGEWWKNSSYDLGLNKFIYEELNSKAFKFNEAELKEKITKFHEKINKHLLDEIKDSWWKQIFTKAKNKRKEEENKRVFYETLEKYKIQGLELAENISIKYFANLEKEKENQIKLEQLYKEVFIIINNLNNCYGEFLENIDIIKMAFNKYKFEEVKKDILNNKPVKDSVKKLLDALSKLEKWQKELKQNEELSDIQKKLLNNSILEDGTIKKTDIEMMIEFAILQNILNLEKDENIKEAIKYMDDFENIVSLTNEKMKLKQKLVKDYILSKCQKQIDLLKYESGYKEFKRQAEKKRALWSIRKYMESYGEEVLTAFPCFLLGPETVSNILPLIEGMFDVVIFDEASQMYIEEAIPTIYRAKKVVIAGDDKQLKPSGVFKSTISNEIDDEDEERKDLAALEEESLLDLAKVNYDKLHLTYHYRSKYEELISFSNYAFYDGRLKVSPNIIKNNNEFQAIERIKCDGRWLDRANIEEAKEIVELVYKILIERKNYETLGIITFNITQKAMIEDMLEQKAQEDSVFRNLYIKEMERVQDSEDVSLFVKNIENVQGDERDVIIFSIGYGKNEKGRVSTNFGALSQDGGENRLNVAISRAKQKIYLVTSIEPEELNVESAKNKGPILFKKYLQYVRAVSKGDSVEAKVILNSLIDSDITLNEERKHDSDFEAEVYDALIKHRYEVYTQIGVSGYKIDLAIYDRQMGKYILGIECDGATFHSSKSARERDIHRQRYLEARGWNITRIWSRRWWKNPDAEIKKIQKVINEIKKRSVTLDLKKEEII